MGTLDTTNGSTEGRTHRRSRVVIAGGGVAALEGLIALRKLLDGLLEIDIVAPSADFVYRPLSVAEPFGLTVPHRFDLRKIAADHAAELHSGTLEAVNHERKEVSVRGGPALSYDALLVAVGARPRLWLGGAAHFAGPEDVARLRTIMAELEEGAIGGVVFTAPAGLSWTLPLYELALLTASRAAERGRGDGRLAVVTPEHNPMGVFGPAAERHIRELFANRGIELRAGTTALSFSDGRLLVDRGGDIEADRVVALPKLEGEAIPGLPHDSAGFIPVDEHCAVRGIPGVYAAGDAIAYPIKQGGLATQEADAAAEAIAAKLGAAIDPLPFQPRLRGELLTGLGPSYLRSAATEVQPSESIVAANPLWWPPTKIAARYLGPYLSNSAVAGGSEQLVDRAPAAPRSFEEAEADREDVRRIALAFAESDASDGDYRSALGWLDTLEELDGMLSPALTQKQSDWRRRLG